MAGQENLWLSIEAKTPVQLRIELMQGEMET